MWARGPLASVALLAALVAFVAFQLSDPAPQVRVKGTTVTTAPAEDVEPHDAPAETELVSLRLSFTGGVYLDPGVKTAAQGVGVFTAKPFDFGMALQQVKPLLEESDLALCHLGQPLTLDDPPAPVEAAATEGEVLPTFNAFSSVVSALSEAGYDGCSAASNRALEQGVGGVIGTISTLQRAGLVQSGMADDPIEAFATPMYEVEGVQVAHLSFTTTVNQREPLGEVPFLVGLADLPTMLAKADAARASGADFVVVSVHFAENGPEPTDAQQQIAKALLASDDVDLVIGHGPVVQPIDRVGDEFVAYSLGNQLADIPQGGVPDGVILGVEITGVVGDEFHVTSLTHVATYYDAATGVVVPVARTLDAPDTPEPFRDELWAAWDRVLARLDARGADWYGVRPLETPS
ncbi:MAG: hypothetical protein JJLCMIEE_01459 [Acidimicrobiales bacterium]|nr:MAG: hypothetical protein EDR02_06435 [Actinomycetota bacterium]MBV6508398.1 hypothetical protein [Acidimicrobiales bacterium]